MILVEVQNHGQRTCQSSDQQTDSPWLDQKAFVRFSRVMVNPKLAAVSVLYGGHLPVKHKPCVVTRDDDPRRDALAGELLPSHAIAIQRGTHVVLVGLDQVGGAELLHSRLNQFTLSAWPASYAKLVNKRVDADYGSISGRPKPDALEFCLGG